MERVTDELVHSTSMTVHSTCAARMGLVVHVPDRILAGDKCGVCDPEYRPWSDLVARDFGKREKCCTTKRVGADLPDPTSTTAERGKSRHAPHSAPLVVPPSLDGLTSREAGDVLGIGGSAIRMRRLRGRHNGAERV